MAFLQVNNLTKSFGGLQAVKSLKFSVNKGDILGVVGPNGAGKTTTFNLILGFQRPNSGNISFKNKELSGLTPHEICKAGLARTFQLTKPFRDVSVYENVKIAAFNRAKNSKEANKIALEALDFLGLSKYNDKLAKNLTIPDQKNLEIARALATKPEILFFDEPISGLNETETHEMMKLIRRINGHGITIIAIEHVMKAIMSLSNRIIVLNHGVKIAEGTPSEIAKNDKVIDSYLGEEYTVA